ncbi:MAG: hypothetical protein J7L23_00730 [Candidatus Diapherotrites archaeon]|nr:hypothetical protein [Candidatus Diapherotrites archaeon]
MNVMVGETEIKKPQVMVTETAPNVPTQPKKSSGNIGKLFGRMKLPLLLVVVWATFAIFMGVVNLVVPVSGWREGVSIFQGDWLGSSALGFYTSMCMVLTLWIGWTTVKNYGETLKQAFFAGSLFGLIIGLISKALSIIFVFINAIHTFFQYSGFSIDKLGRALGKAFSAVVNSFGLDAGILGFLGWLVGLALGVLVASVIEGGLIAVLAGMIAMGKPKNELMKTDFGKTE